MTPEQLIAAGEALFPGLAWSQPNDLATALSVPHTTLYQYKMGRRPIPAVVATLIEHLLKE